MIKARLKVRTGDLKTSQSVVRAIKPDNLGMKGLRTKERANPDSAQFLMEYEGKIETFISTLDDMLVCIQAASGTLKTIDRNME